jgi:hypothetical protein
MAEHPAIKKATDKQAATHEPDTEHPSTAAHPMHTAAKSRDQQASDTHDKLLHQASGTVHQVPAHGTHTADQGGGIDVDTHGHDHANAVGKTKTKGGGASGRNKNKNHKINRLQRELRNRMGFGGNGGGGGGDGLEGASAIGKIPMPAGSSESGSGASGGSSAVPIIIGVLVLGVGGFLLYNKIHKAGASEHALNKGEAPSG